MKKFILKLKNSSRENIITCFVVFCCLISFWLFPIKDSFQVAISMIIFFLIIPLAYLKFILKKNLSHYGFQAGDWKSGLFLSSLALFISLGIFLLLFYKTDLSNYWLLSKSIRTDFLVFIFYEFFQALFYYALFEIFFRGFVMFSFMKSIKYWSILVQFLVFLCLLLLLKSFNFQHLLLIISAFFSGIIAYRSKSIYYSLATTILFLFLCDVFLIKFVIQ